MEQNQDPTCEQRKEHGRATEPRFEITLPPVKTTADEVFGSLLGPEKSKDLDGTG